MFPRADATAYIGGSVSNPPVETTQAAPPDLAKVSIDQFMQIDLRVADIRAAEKVEKSKKLIKLTVFDGTSERTVVAGIATRLNPVCPFGHSGAIGVSFDRVSTAVVSLVGEAFLTRTSFRAGSSSLSARGISPLPRYTPTFRKMRA